eukprot:TRINITY_DN25917_c0_g1_i1.p1 TRINITY_DN25917_c0_g1~~TRINITY_DN25917_c0_g1_i1.p1  ORF type:complete len:295 (+),score=40.02 TRINITY_DN25917_c0_g1_i1:8-892(+)
MGSYFSGGEDDVQQEDYQLSPEEPILCPNVDLSTPEKREAVALKLKSQLEERGVVFFRDPVWASEGTDEPLEGRLQKYFDLCAHLGVVWDEKMIYVDTQFKSYVRSPNPVPFHTDSLKANIIAWYCIHPGDNDHTETQYLHTRAIYNQLTPTDQDLLKQVLCRDPLQLKTADDEVGPQENIIDYSQSRDGHTPALFWISHRLSVPPQGDTLLEERIDGALRKYKGLLSGSDPSVPVIRVEMKRGDFVVIDNNSVLHARNAISPQSLRKLYRLYINTTNDPAIQWSQRSQPRISI